MRIFFFILLIFFYSKNLLADQSIWYLDIDSLLKNSNKGQIILNNLNELETNNKNDLMNKENKIKKLDEEIKNLENIISETELQNKINILKKEINLYKKYQTNISNEFFQIKRQKIENFFKNIAPIIENYMKENAINIVLDKKNIFIANSNYDITSEIIEIINNKN